MYLYIFIENILIKSLLLLFTAHHCSTKVDDATDKAKHRCYHIMSMLRTFGGLFCITFSFDFVWFTLANFDLRLCFSTAENALHNRHNNFTAILNADFVHAIIFRTKIIQTASLDCKKRVKGRVRKTPFLRSSRYIPYSTSARLIRIVDKNLVGCIVDCLTELKLNVNANCALNLYKV